MKKINKKRMNQFTDSDSGRLINGLKTILLGLITAFIGNFSLQLFQNQYNFSLAIHFTFQWHTEMFLLGMFLLFTLYLWLTALSGSRWLSALILLIITVAMGVTTQQKMALRGEPLYPSDFTMINELPFLLKMVDRKLVIAVIILLISLVSLGIILFIKKKEVQSNGLIRYKRN